ncbi:hypothetical protein SPIROBIBN47_240001 [uncultured spirochete]|uniref:Uncharacterized protein n=1 Tax=uncultured spirochete TaxID=156406 RepID=A0A3P3XHT4_9SPIR|nr:hypothetical protein SPIROBIBN47_240001 [uncultured spirochete]
MARTPYREIWGIERAAEEVWNWEKVVISALNLV